MRLSLSSVALFHAGVYLVGQVEGFAATIPKSLSNNLARSSYSNLDAAVTTTFMSAVVEGGETNTSSKSEEVDIPRNLPSECGMDYVPLATMLATGNFKDADQFTRDALIVISGAKAKKRDFVYFTDVKNIPNTDLATIERLWKKFSNGKFGYSIQKKKMKQSKGDFEQFCRKIGWNTKDGEIERKLRWFGASEFTYDLKKAPEGHLPLTSALRGTSLIKSLLNHPVWDNDDWTKVPEN